MEIKFFKEYIKENAGEGAAWGHKETPKYNNPDNIKGSDTVNIKELNRLFNNINNRLNNLERIRKK